MREKYRKRATVLRPDIPPHQSPRKRHKFLAANFNRARHGVRHAVKNELSVPDLGSAHLNAKLDRRCLDQHFPYPAALFKIAGSSASDARAAPRPVIIASVR